MGFSSKFNYKNWDFGFSGRISLGNYVYNNVIVGARYQELTVNEYLTNMPSEINFSKFETAQQYSDYFVEDASFLRLDNISLGYTFEKIIKDKVNLRLYSTVQNVFVITDYNGLDPEIPSGIDNDVYPRPRTFTFGLSANF
jgi:iron complex outermembrane receptor protein